ncbi:hypothetical protein Bca4012_026976 [Brassica carinata]
MAILSTEVSDGFKITLLKLALKPDSPLYLDMILDHPKTLAYDLHRAEVHTQMERTTATSLKNRSSSIVLQED